MKIGISGASGHLGKATISELVKRGLAGATVGISRSPGEVNTQVEARHGDYDRPDALSKAYKDVDRLLLIPSAELAPGKRGSQLKHAIDAAVQANVSHLFLISASGTREVPSASLNAGFWEAEQHLIANSPRWTILRMNYYAESMAEEIQMSINHGVIAGLGQEAVAYLSRADLAAAAAGALAGMGQSGTIYNITGPAILDGEEKARIASSVYRKPVRFEQVSEPTLIQGLTHAGLPEHVAHVVAQIKQTFVDGNFDILTHDMLRLAGREPIGFEQVLAGCESGAAQR